MGLPVSVHLRGPRARTRAVEERVARVFAELRAADAVFSTYRPESVLGRLRGAPPGPAATADPLVREVAGLCETARARTDGWFDARRLPLPLGGTGFDPSGLVKGWAVERAARHLTDLADHDLCLNAGGDVLLRTAPGRPPWRIGVEDPDRPERMLDVVERAGGAVATSGTARRGAHITDRAPDGRPRPSGRSPWSVRTCSGPTCTRPRRSPAARTRRSGWPPWTGTRPCWWTPPAGSGPPRAGPGPVSRPAAWRAGPGPGRG